MPTIQELIGDKVLKQDGTEVEVASFCGPDKVVGIYFSAHWCPPCRGFTPKLADFYKAVKKSKPDNFEIVFVSSDRNKDSFNEYFGEMPWLALDFDKRDVKESVGGVFDVRGIPTLVFLDGEGNVITKDGRSKVMEDPNGEKYP